jgi:hypothetical protein
VATLVISYSRADQAQVRAVVSLLQGALSDVEETIFWDGQLELGEPRFQQLKTHIDAAPQLFVFWCGHSSSSAEVRREFVYALQQRKRVIPVLLDDTPLADELAPIHGIDLRGAIRHRRSGRPTIAMKLALAAILVSILAATSLFVVTRSRTRPMAYERVEVDREIPRPLPPSPAPPSVVPSSTPSAPTDPPMQERRAPSPIVATAALVVTLGLLMLGLFRLQKRRRRMFVVRQFAHHISSEAS